MKVSVVFSTSVITVGLPYFSVLKFSHSSVKATLSYLQFQVK